LQDEQINQVAYQVSQVDAYMENANDTLKKAVRSAKTARRRRWCLVVFCLILVGVLAAVVAIYVVPKLQSSPPQN
jgi:syntaxin 1B/2/3